MVGTTDHSDRFSGRVAIVTCGVLGFGSGTARKLASRGARVLVVDVIGMTKQMALDFGPFGIRVNCIPLGHIATEKTQAPTWDRTPGGFKFFEQQYPVRRTGVSEDIANAISFLYSDDASFIRGHPLAVGAG